MSTNQVRCLMAGHNDGAESRLQGFDGVFSFGGLWILFLLLCATLALAGCGSTGGYVGGGIVSISKSSATIDAGQSVKVTSVLSGDVNVTWTLSACGAASCGTLSSTTGPSIIYTAPVSVTTSLKVAITETVPGTKNSDVVNVTINPDPVITGTPAPGTVGSVYSTTFVAAGGTAPLTSIVLVGTLPAGLSFNGATGIVSGTPTVAGTFTFSLQVTDSSDSPFMVTVPETIVISAGTGGGLTVISGNPPGGFINVNYTFTFQVSGGTGPYTWSILTGGLPPGLVLSTTGTISGLPTTAGSYTFTIQVVDASGAKVTVVVTIVIVQGGGNLTVIYPPGGTLNVVYYGTIIVNGGTAPYNCALVSGALPTGLTLNGCVLSGTPTSIGTFNFFIRITDSGNPAVVLITQITIVIGGPSVTITIVSPPPATVGVPYSGPIVISGGTSPYTCVLVSGTLPAGLTLNGCTVTGTPTGPGHFTFIIEVIDSGNPSNTQTGPITIIINAAPLTLSGSPPIGFVGYPYTTTFQGGGGTTPYLWSIISGGLPTGLTLSVTTGVISGTPMIAGTYTFVLQIQDANGLTVNRVFTITINAGPPVLVLGNPPPGMVNVFYNASIVISGGTSPYNCVLVSGPLPPGLSLASNCTLTGTPTTAGPYNITIRVTDSSSPVNTFTGQITITINAPSVTISIASPPPATEGTPYNGPIVISGGTPPYTCVLVSGSLPAGLSLGSNCVVTGTPTTTGGYPITITVTDSGSPVVTQTGQITITVNAPATLTLTGSIPDGILNVAYLQTLHASGGVPPYSYALTAGLLPPGITLSTGGVISGTPTAVGGFAFTVTVTDTTSPTAMTASLPLVLKIKYPVGPNVGELDGPYAFLFQGYDDSVAGVLSSQTATVGSFVADGLGSLTGGELDTNHQTSTATGSTVSSQRFIGTYTVNPDNRGFLTITTFGGSGVSTSTYAISLQAAIAPSTISVRGSLIEYDNDTLAGTKGSGTLLAQDPTALMTGLAGSYVFGLEGDTPCLLTCGVGVLSGPAASVAEFAIDASTSAVTGTSDATVTTSTYASAALTGSAGAIDGNGRVQLTMATAGAPTTFPSDYVVYVVDAKNAFVMSNDAHSAYILLAGSAQGRTQTTFSNASLSNSMIGYENSTTNPGLLSATLQNTLNFSTATIFRATATSDGNCNVTSVDTGGLGSLLTDLTGLGGVLLGLQNLLGTYNATGAVTCPIASNGRGLLQYPQQVLLGLPVGTPPSPRVLYLSAPDRGYFLESGYAGLGHIEPQTGSPYNLASFDGTYVYGTTPASSIVSITSSGYVTADGAGNETSVLDSNVGVGTINILQPSMAGSATYTTPDATTGRFLINTTTVVYVIGPGRFVLVDTNALTTSPTVTLLY